MSTIDWVYFGSFLGILAGIIGLRTKKTVKVLSNRKEEPSKPSTNDK
ncbi:MAG: hypothetical protein ABIJ45_00795 [Candidatus Zixiibacteriota bacterium]